MHLIVSALIVTCTLPQAMGAPKASQSLAPIVINGRSAGVSKPTGEVDGPRQQFTELIGLEVRNLQNEKLGRIKAITTDLPRSRLVEVLISTKSGLLGMHEVITPVPPTAFTVSTAHEIAYLNVSKARFDAAAKLPAMNAAVYSQTDRAAAASRYFGVKPWFVPSGLGYVQTTAAIEMMQIKNAQGKYLGSVGMLFMDLPSGRLNQVVDDTVSMDGNGSHILPPAAFSFNANHNGLVLNESFPQLADMRHFHWAHGTFDDTNYFEEILPAERNTPGAHVKSVAAPVRLTRPLVASRHTVVAGRTTQTKRHPATASSKKQQHAPAYSANTRRQVAAQ